MRSLLNIALLVSVVSGQLVHLPDLFGPGCTGAKLPTKTFPTCYSGKASVLGGAFSEGVVLTITEFDYTKKTGTMNIRATGVQPETCSALPFSVDGQEGRFDPKGCLGPTTVKAMFCGDQDTISLHVQIPHFPIASVPVTLRPEPCPSDA